MSTRNKEEFFVKLFNAGKEARMISQKLAMIGVQLYNGYKVSKNRQVVDVSPITSRSVEEKKMVNKMFNEGLKQEFREIFEKNF